MHKIANEIDVLDEPDIIEPTERKMKPSHWVIFILICAIMAALVFITVLHVINTDSTKARPLHMAIPVETVSAHVQSLDEVIGGSGAVEQSSTVVLVGQLEARVVDVPLKIGDLVKKGQLLAQWDDRLIQATLEADRQAVANNKLKMENLTRQVDRYKDLVSKNMGSPLDVEKAEIALADARDTYSKATLALQQSEIDSENSKMLSPIDGIVLERIVNPGEWTHRDQVLFKIGSLSTVYMAAKVTEEKLHSVDIELPAETSFPAFPGQSFPGKVVKIDPNIDVVTRTFTTYVEIDNPDLRLKPGLSGFTRIRHNRKDSLAVPSVAVLNPSGEQAAVFVVDNTNHANLRKVSTGIIANAMTEITSGLKEGERVVTVGQLYLKENDKVQTTSKSKFDK
jgi:RND family efflux transporter MFP subunit